LAVSVFYWSILFLLENNVKKFILINIINIFLFHKSAIFFLIMLPLIIGKTNKRIYNLFIPIAGLYLYVLGSFLLELFKNLMEILPDFFTIKLKFYVDNLNTNSSLNKINTFIQEFFLFILF
jgi:hypothetical protein